MRRMARIFLSHSSGNNAEATALRDWLIGQGWDDLFLDLDPERGLKAGERWQAALKQAAERCELVIFLVWPVGTKAISIRLLPILMQSCGRPRTMSIRWLTMAAFSWAKATMT